MYEVSRTSHASCQVDLLRLHLTTSTEDDMGTSNQTDHEGQQVICKDGDCDERGEPELANVRYIKESKHFRGHEVISIAIICLSWARVDVCFG